MCCCQASGLRRAMLVLAHSRAVPGQSCPSGTAVKQLGRVGEHPALGGLDRIGNGAVRGQPSPAGEGAGHGCRRARQPSRRQPDVAEHQLRPFDVHLGRRLGRRGL
jgi:hypothetical protein